MTEITRRLNDGAEQLERLIRDAAAVSSQTLERARQTLAVAEAALARTERVAQSSEGGSGVAREVVGAIEGVLTAARRISETISVINEISFQTSLLSLNSSVEAARAGEAGRGFMVVASEIRNLSLRSAAAADEIQALISTCDRMVATGVESVSRSGDSFRQIGAETRGVTQAVGEMARTTAEQARKIEGMSRSIQSADQIAGSSTQMSRQLEDTAARLNANARQIGELLNRLCAAA